MTTGSWIPEGEKSSLILPGEETLTRWSSLSEQEITDLESESLASLSKTMNAGVENWQTHLANYDANVLEGLLRFFTLVEMAHSSLRADKHNPAIACAKLLRKSGNSLDKDLLLWIRAVSDNRFLPYGPL